MSHLSILIILICVYTLIGLPCVLMLDPNDRSEGAWRLLAFFPIPTHSAFYCRDAFGSVG